MKIFRSMGAYLAINNQFNADPYQVQYPEIVNGIFTMHCGKWAIAYLRQLLWAEVAVVSK